MIGINSNIDKFINKYTKRVNAITKTLQEIAEKMAQRMSTDMALEISRNRTLWEESGGTMSRIDSIDFDIRDNGKCGYIVEIGNNLPKVLVGDSKASALRQFLGYEPKLVNPIYFIEFGFGIIGENNQSPHHDEYGWYYNLNQHKDAWYYRDSGNLFSSMGTKGINFMYNTIEKYRVDWKKYLFTLIKENS